MIAKDGLARSSCPFSSTLPSRHEALGCSGSGAIPGAIDESKDDAPAGEEAHRGSHDDAGVAHDGAASSPALTACASSRDRLTASLRRLQLRLPPFRHGSSRADGDSIVR